MSDEESQYIMNDYNHSEKEQPADGFHESLFQRCRIVEELREKARKYLKAHADYIIATSSI